MKALYFKLLFLFITLSTTGYSQTAQKSPEYKDKVQFDQKENESIYSFLVKNNLTSKSEKDFYTTYSDSAKARELYGFLLENKLTDKEFGNFYMDNFPKGKLVAGLPETQVGNTDNTYSSFQTDKIKVGDTFIDLPIPSGFVKIDETRKILYESAKKMCPESNTLLAYYLSAEDYANFLANQSSSFDKYIFVEVFNGLKGKQVGSKDYRQFLNSFKKEYIDKFQKDLEKGGMQAAENLSKIDENLKMENIKMLPFGICYESENSISYGILSKCTFAVNDESSTDYIVAAISSITKVDQKPIFLYSYQTYKSAEDINSLKALNTSWVKEIDKRQSPVSFFSDFDFKDYKEAIFAILTLSFIWAIYFATKKIQRKLKSQNVEAKPEIEDNKEYFDLDELFTEEKILIEPIPIMVEPEKIQEKVQIINPELLKVSRQLRFFNLLIDIVFLYFLAYVAGYVLVFLFGQTAASKLIQNQYLFGSSVSIR